MFDAYGLGGANQQWMTVTMYMYYQGWGQFNFGRAAAVAWILFLLIILIGLINLAVTRRIANDGGGKRS
jgi:cellobiose transport system permease protein